MLILLILISLSHFNYFYQLGKTGVAVLDIKAQKDIQVGFGNIKIESEVVNEETVYTVVKSRSNKG